MDSIKDLDFMTDVSEYQVDKIEGGEDNRHPRIIPKDFVGAGQPFLISNEVDLERIAIAKNGGTAIVNQNVNIFNLFIIL
ncbi:MAG: hypothetical protein F6J94_04120 [Moorea sp. SIO1F2]|uniref:hypothetical protein n=1 Tax=Moorena sp. SIO1F2 TaxID=2607819 RepID=UPI0013BCCDF5|nr:hypothetical protein [Moorena sp. SIO1F2]NET81167.1 hypothetical protein [Moorena sp. SIO1F2]